MNEKLMEEEIINLKKIRDFFLRDEGKLLVDIFKANKDTRIQDIISSNKENLQKHQGELIAWNDIIEFIQNDSIQFIINDKVNKLEEFQGVDN